MKSPFQRSLAYCAILLTATIAAPPAVATSKETIATSVGRLLEEGHYTRQKLNEEISKKFLQTYLELLDYSHLFFTQKDVDELNAKYGNSIAGDVLLGTLKPAYEIYDLYAKRVDDRVANIKELLKQSLDSKTDANIELSRQKSPWPKDEAEADQLWRGRIASELLQEKLSEHPIEPGPQLVSRRYDRLARNVHEEDREEQMKLFLDALAQTYDPHSEYLSKADLKNFSINMGLSLVGIGAMLRTEDGYAKIESLVPGGPAQTDGRLKVGDRITAVGQGNGEFTDVRDMRRDNVVELRHSGGGSLEEAIALTGLFLKSGPIVQTKGSNGNIVVSSDPDPGIAYTGPMIVLTSRQSASASEIFAAALQDYGRAVVVGDKQTFGKGTVQTILEIGKFTSLLGSHSQEDGALKLTIQKFYRVAGGSTQLKGVESDIVLPTLSDLPEYGEGALKNCLPYDEVPKAKFTKWSDSNHQLFIDELKRRSETRVQASPEFRYVMEDVDRLRRRLDENRISLNEEVRRTEMDED